jgi:hypothetical protein
MYAKVAHWFEVVTCFSKACDLFPAKPDTWCKLGYAQLARGDSAGFRETVRIVRLQFSDT